MPETEANKSLVVRALAILTGEAAADEAKELFTETYIDHNVTGHAGPGWVASVAGRLRGTFPDLSHEVHTLLAEGDLVALYTTMRGTHEGVFVPLRLPATGRKIEIDTFHVFRIDNGRIAEHWAVRDDLGMFRQLGVMSRPGEAAVSSNA